MSCHSKLTGLRHLQSDLAVLCNWFHTTASGCPCDTNPLFPLVGISRESSSTKMKPFPVVRVGNGLFEWAGWLTWIAASMFCPIKWPYCSPTWLALRQTAISNMYFMPHFILFSKSIWFILPAMFILMVKQGDSNCFQYKQTSATSPGCHVTVHVSCSCSCALLQISLTYAVRRRQTQTDGFWFWIHLLC